MFYIYIYIYIYSSVVHTPLVVSAPLSYIHLRAHETREHLACRLMPEKNTYTHLPSHDNQATSVCRVLLANNHIHMTH